MLKGIYNLRVEYLIMLFLSIFISSCKDKYPTEYKNDLPFGLQYYMSRNQVYSRMDSLLNIGCLSTRYKDTNSYVFNLKDNKDFDFNIEFRFFNDSLYYIDIRNNNLLLTSKIPNEDIYKLEMDFFKSQEINLNTYQKRNEKTLNSYTWSNNEGMEISFYTDNLIIIFNDGVITDRINEEDNKRNAEERKRRFLNKMSNEDFCTSITDINAGIYKATITDSKMLVLGVNPIGNPNFDVLAKYYLENAIEKGLEVNGCLVVDINKSTWIKGAVKGERIGKAYK